MNHASESCPDCERLSADYESATIRWFRLDSQMQIAEFGLDRDASCRIADELAAVHERRQTLRRALRDHICRRHGNMTALAAA